MLALVFVAGCGSGGGGGSVQPTPPPAAADPPPSPPPDPPPPDPSPPPPDPSPPPPAAVPSGAITGVTFNWSSHRRLAGGSDNWPATWSNDDHQYAVWGDGGGFGGSDSDGRSSFGVARIQGDHNNYTGVNRFGGKRGECGSGLVGKGHGAPLSIGGVLYAWVTPGSGPRGYDSFTLYRSRNKGCSWSRLDVRFTRASHGVSFGSFVQFGKDNGAARDAYVYTVAAAVTNASTLDVVQRPGRIMLVRVPVTAIEDRGAYEFYAGLDSSGQPTWSESASRRIPIYEDPAGVGPFPQMSFVPGLDRLVYTNQHGDGRRTSSTRSLLTMAEAPQPWGPWNVFHQAVFFPQIERTVFQWSFAPKWFRNGGRGFTIIFSGINSNDSWNTVDGAFTVEP